MAHDLRSAANRAAWLASKLQLPVCLVVLLLFASPIVLPLTRQGFYASHDILLHIGRAHELEGALADGSLYPRWFPRLAVGLGFPVFTYYSPLSYYVAVAFSSLGFGTIGGVNLALLVAVLAGGWGTFFLARDIYQRYPPALLAGVAFAAMPYLVADIYLRGALAEVVAGGLLPWSLWALRRLVLGRRRGYLAPASLLLAALMLAHNLTAAFSFPLALAYGVFLLRGDLYAALRHAGPPWRRARRALLLLWQRGLVLVFALAAGVSAFFWLPALLEAGNISYGLASYKLEQDLEPWRDLVQRRLDFYYPDSRKVGGVQALMVSATVVALAGQVWFRRRRRRPLPAAVGEMLFLVALLAAAAFLLTTAAEFVWYLIPGHGIFQFSWRLLMLVGLVIALLSGFLASPRRWGWLVALGGGAAMVYSSWFSPPQEFLPADSAELQRQGFARYELRLWRLGGSVTRELTPVWALSGFPGEFDTRALNKVTQGPALKAARVLEFGRNYQRLLVSAEAPSVLRFHSFYFPGWRATLDGRPVEVFPSSKFGLLSVEVPPGDHEVAVWREYTRPQQLAVGLSALAAGIVAATALKRSAPGRRRLLLVLVVAAPLALVLVWSLILAPRLHQRRTAVPSPAPADVPVRLVAYHQQVTRVGARPAVRLTSFWMASESIGEDLWFGLQLRDSDGREVVSTRWQPLVNTTPTSVWSVNEVVRDERVVVLPPDAPADSYRARLSLLDPSGRPLWGASLAEVVIPDVGVPAPPEPRYRVNAVVGGVVELVGFDLVPTNGGFFGLDEGTPQAATGAPITTIAPRGRLMVTLYWRALRPVPEDYDVFVHILDISGEMRSQSDGEPGGGLRPTATWQEGELVVDRHSLYVERDLQPGVYELSAGLYDQEDLHRLSVPGSADNRVVLALVKVPSRMDDALSAASPVGATFVNGVELASYRLEDGPGRGEKTVVLYWRPQRVLAEDWTVFVHAYDEEGRLVLQHDSPPAQGWYPTRFWSPGEVIADAHPLPAAEGGGRLTLQAGLYLPATGERLPTVDGAPSVVLTTLAQADLPVTD